MSAEDGFPHFIEVGGHKEAPGNFKRLIQMAKKAHPMGAAVDVHKVSDYKTHRLFLTEDGMAGYSVKPDGEMTSVFNHPDSPYKNVARHAAEHAVLIGGATHASAFDPVLPGLYQKGGFKAVGRNAWNEDYKPSGWKTSKQGRPDVVFMAADRTVARPDTPKYHPERTPYLEGASGVDDYSAGNVVARNIGKQNNEAQVPRAGHFGIGFTGARETPGGK